MFEMDGEEEVGGARKTKIRHIGKREDPEKK